MIVENREGMISLFSNGRAVLSHSVQFPFIVAQSAVYHTQKSAKTSHTVRKVQKEVPLRNCNVLSANEHECKLQFSYGGVSVLLCATENANVVEFAFDGLDSSVGVLVNLTGDNGERIYSLSDHPVELTGKKIDAMNHHVVLSERSSVLCRHFVVGKEICCDCGFVSDNGYTLKFETDGGVFADFSVSGVNRLAFEKCPQKIIFRA